mgnify:CR=1 FL=1
MTGAFSSAAASFRRLLRQTTQFSLFGCAQSLGERSTRPGFGAARIAPVHLFGTLGLVLKRLCAVFVGAFVRLRSLSACGAGNRAMNVRVWLPSMNKSSVRPGRPHNSMLE